jgi:hypothetical protein
MLQCAPAIVVEGMSPIRIDHAVPIPVRSGPIILQSEGAEVFYRDIASARSRRSRRNSPRISVPA